MIDNDNDKDIDMAASGWLKKIPLDEPSEHFTKNVMSSVYALENYKPLSNKGYWWFLLLIPVLVAGGWYLSSLPEFIARISDILTSVRNSYTSLNAGFGEFFGRFREISISPVVILIFLAVLSLLVVEDIFSKSRHKINADA